MGAAPGVGRVGVGDLRVSPERWWPEWARPPRNQVGLVAHTSRDVVPCPPGQSGAPGCIVPCLLSQMVIVGRSTRERWSPRTWLSPMLGPPGRQGLKEAGPARLLPSAPLEFLLILA